MKCDIENRKERGGRGGGGKRHRGAGLMCHK